MEKRPLFPLLIVENIRQYLDILPYGLVYQWVEKR